ncbi:MULTISPECIES: D-erythronate dehydrogenase [unclassified Imperialibacter]|uniref:D-erythronate dehydrogenase n=1 Tax=unclassified Imperialibacter TaxID=2629706 RepID=UPI00125A9324|nr:MULTISPECIES: D-erythronate dehydrogenase [unclassified Imperialibacter]CAD5250803.1 D-erythronate dehydrogenase [Imperialibacter sp. 75]CAD5285677.1 D-erythronate dehydrogenase [Imperialibacter sp. 89]VVT04896.1 D-erythronate dehydrogenase [Imperialibacter sp. EC-SDR9]
MQIIITGGAGFLGQRLANALLSSHLVFDELLLVDIVMPPHSENDSRVRCLQIDLSEEGAAKSLVSAETGIVFHLAAVVSSHAEKDFDLGWKINMDITRQLLEVCRHQKPGIRFIFSSSIAVFGGDLPATVLDTTALTPRSSYGAQKAIGELLVNDYSRKGLVDGRVLRLPTICVRPGKPNLAASSFVSSIIREPINGEDAICPVSTDLALWLSSPETVIQNLIHATTLKAEAFGGWRTVNLPGVSVTVQQMLDSLERMSGKATLARVQFKPDPAINAIVSSWPAAIDNTRGLALGFTVDGQFDAFITQFIASSKPSAG